MGGAVQMVEPPRLYDFTCDWVTPHLPVWRAVFEHVKPRRILEVGCFEGRATTVFMAECAKYGPLSITCVDTWDGAIDLPQSRMNGVEARFDANTALALGTAETIVTFRKIKKPSSVALPALIADGDQFELVYIDGSHTAPDVLADAVDGFRLLRVGGAMIFDDYVWCMEPHGNEDALNMPKPAIDAFININARKLRLMHISSQIALVKTHD